MSQVKVTMKQHLEKLFLEATKRSLLILIISIFKFQALIKLSESLVQVQLVIKFQTQLAIKFKFEQRQSIQFQTQLVINNKFDRRQLIQF